jgi:signal transduction histidine kinase
LFRITARTVLELGSELISSDIIAFYELIKNGFDARTKMGVEVRFDIPLSRSSYLRLADKVAAGSNLSRLKELVISALDLSSSVAARDGFRTTIESAGNCEELQDRLAEAQVRYNTITVADTGSGMSLDDLKHSFLVIGTPSRKREVEAALRRGDRETPYLGEKGIGRLSAMRLGEHLRVETARDVDSQINVLEIDWSAFADVDAMLDQIPVTPIVGPKKPSPKWSGTSVVISNLSENWTETRVREMAEYDFARLTDPFADAGERPRVAIFWNGERKAIPIMPAALLSTAHARVEGHYSVVDGAPSLTCTVEALDLGFDHPKERETITLSFEDLQSAMIGRDRHIEDSALKTVGPFSFEAYWYNRSRLSRVDAIGEQRAVRELQEKWSGIMLFRDRFRVFPYGEDEDDWLELDRRALRRSGYTLNKTQFIGRVSISRTANPMLVDQTNREGLRITPEQQVFLEVIRYAVQDRLGSFMRDVERQYKNQKIDLSDAQAQVTRLEDRAKNAIRRLKRLTPPEGDEAIEDLQQTLFEFTEFAARARQRIVEVEQESRQMIEMAGVGLMVEVVAHELARASENALKALDRLRSKDVPDSLRAHFNTLQAELKSVSKRVRVLDPMSVSGRQRTEAFALDALIRDTLEAHQAQFARHNIRVVPDMPERSVRIRAVKGMIVQILENLISNSIYWLDMRAEREQRFKPEIRITLESGPPTITFEDNGRGIAPDNREQIFKAFFSLKDTRRRRGLGLFIAREAAQHNGGTLTLSDSINPETSRLHRFILELPEGAQL